jgi:hypothetical protein
MIYIDDEWRAKAIAFTKDEKMQYLAEHFRNNNLLRKQEEDIYWVRKKLGVLFAPIMNEEFGKNYSLEYYNMLGLDIPFKDVLAVAAGFIEEEEQITQRKDYGDASVIENLNYIGFEELRIGLRAYFENEPEEAQTQVNNENDTTDIKNQIDGFIESWFAQNNIKEPSTINIADDNGIYSVKGYDVSNPEKSIVLGDEKQATNRENVMEKLDELKKPPKAEPEAVGKFDKQFKELREYKGDDMDFYDDKLEELYESMTEEEQTKYEKELDVLASNTEIFKS